MKTLITLAFLCGLAAPVVAQDALGQGPTPKEFPKGAEDALRNLFDRLKPGLEELLGRIDELTYYEAPEFLPNGDIIIRRRKDAPPIAPDEPVDL